MQSAPSIIACALLGLLPSSGCGESSVVAFFCMALTARMELAHPRCSAAWKSAGIALNSCLAEGHLHARKNDAMVFILVQHIFCASTSTGGSKKVKLKIWQWMRPNKKRVETCLFVLCAPGAMLHALECCICLGLAWHLRFIPNIASKKHFVRSKHLIYPDTSRTVHIFAKLHQAKQNITSFHDRRNNVPCPPLVF